MKTHSRLSLKYLYYLLAAIASFLVGSYSSAKKGSIQNKMDRVSNHRSSSKSNLNTNNQSSSLSEKLIWSESGVLSAKESQLKMDHLIAWAETNPLEALKYAMKYMGRDSFIAVAEVLHVWARQDPKTAWQWTLDHSPNHARRILKTIANTDPKLGWRLSTEHAQRRPELANAFLRSSLSGILQSGDYDLAMRFIAETEGLPKGKENILRFTIADWVSYDPPAALAWIENLPDDGPLGQKTRIETEYAKALVCFAPDEALDYSRNVKDAALKSDLSQASISEFIRRDPSVAVDWINKLGKGPELDWSMHELALTPEILNNDIHTSIKWAQSINASDKREDGLIEIMARWLVKDPEAAYAYFEDGQVLPKRAILVAETYAMNEIREKKKKINYSEY